jgi:hypothetical protein
MFNISQLLNKIRAAQGGSLLVREVIKGAVKKNVGADISLEDINTKSARISIKNLPSAARSEIFMKRIQILNEINTEIEARVGGAKKTEFKEIN